MKRFWKISGATAGLAGAAVAAAGVTGGFGAIRPKSAAPTPTAEVRTVRVHRVAAAPIARRSYTGVVKPRYESDLGFRVGGKVVSRLVEVGERVSAGQALAKLDPTDFELAVRGAEADVAAAQADARNAAREEQRYREAARTGAASASEYDRTKDARSASAARLDKAERTLALAENKCAYCVLKADADGVVTAMPVEVGQVVAEGQLVARVARAGGWEAVVNLPENRVPEARTASAHVTVWGEVGSGYTASLRELSPTADATSRTYQARFALESPGAELTLGRTVTVYLNPSEAARPALTIPLTAIGRQDGKPIVWRVDGDRLVPVAVIVDGYREDAAVVSSGVRPGDVIVAAGVQKLDAGLRVRAWEGK